MIGYDPKFSHDEMVDRTMTRLRDGMPPPTALEMERMESNQVTPYGDKDDTQVVVYIVSKGTENDRVLYMDAISSQAPLVEQIVELWATFDKKFPMYRLMINEGRMIASLQFER